MNHKMLRPFIVKVSVLGAVHFTLHSLCIKCVNNCKLYVLLIYCIIFQ